MKIITMSKIGYNHPSQANWSYGIWKIDFINTSRDYNGSKIVKETFGGEKRFEASIIKMGYTITETASVYPLPKITGISKMLDIESSELIEVINDFIK